MLDVLLQGSDVGAKFGQNKDAILVLLQHGFEDGLGHNGPQIRKTTTAVVNRLRSFLEEEVGGCWAHLSVVSKVGVGSCGVSSKMK